MSSRLRPIHVYVAVVSAAGLALFVVLAATSGFDDIRRSPGAFWLLGALVVVGELFPVTLPRQNETEEITTTFGFALMLGWGMGAAAIALAAAAVAADTLRKPPWKVLFNVAQYTLAIGAAGGTYTALGGSRILSGADSLPLIAASVVFFVVNDALPEIGVALSQDLPPLHYMRRNLAFQAATTAVLLALAPAVVVLAQRSIILAPLLALPVAAVYVGARVSLRNTQLAEVNRLKDDLLASVSHELRTPLTSIQGYIKTLIQLAGELSEEERREFLEAAGRQTDRLGQLIEQLLVVARLESHVEPLAVATVQLPELAAGVVEELRPRVSGQTFDISFDAEVPAVRTDGGRVHQILSNLVENALKYCPPDTVIVVRGRMEGDAVVVSVADQGPGIPPDAQKRIFERFYQVDQSRTKSVGGTGLGLYICRKLAETIGGDLRLERSGPDGSVFSLRIPSAPLTEAERRPWSVESAVRAS